MVNSLDKGCSEGMKALQSKQWSEPGAFQVDHVDVTVTEREVTHRVSAEKFNESLGGPRGSVSSSPRSYAVTNPSPAASEATSHPRSTAGAQLLIEMAVTRYVQRSQDLGPGVLTSENVWQLKSRKMKVPVNT